MPQVQVKQRGMTRRRAYRSCEVSTSEMGDPGRWSRVVFSMGDRGAEFQLRVPLKLPRDIPSQRLSAGDNEFSIRLVVATATQPPRLSRPAKSTWRSTGNIPSTRGKRVPGVLRMLVGPHSRQGRICNRRGADYRLHHFYSYTTCGLGGRNVALRDGQASRVGCAGACYLLESLWTAL